LTAPKPIAADPARQPAAIPGLGEQQSSPCVCDCRRHLRQAVEEIVNGGGRFRYFKSPAWRFR
jgi:hypothetical protein